MAQRQIELNFIRGMIDHRSQAVQSDQWCFNRNVHDSLRSMCQGIVSSQQHENGMMPGWLTEW